MQENNQAQSQAFFSIYKDLSFKGNMKLQLSIYGEQIAQTLKVALPDLSSIPASDILSFHFYLYWNCFATLQKKRCGAERDLHDLGRSRCC
jgi:hypothetical protein